MEIAKEKEDKEAKKHKRLTEDVYRFFTSKVLKFWVSYCFSWFLCTILIYAYHDIFGNFTGNIIIFQVGGLQISCWR